MAEPILSHAVGAGDWLCLQNCHLAAPWLPRQGSSCMQGGCKTSGNAGAQPQGLCGFHRTWNARKGKHSACLLRLVQLLLLTGHRA